MKTDKTIAELQALGYRTSCRNPEKERRRMVASGERSRRYDVMFDTAQGRRLSEASYARKLYLNLHETNCTNPTSVERTRAHYAGNVEAMTKWRLAYSFYWPRIPNRRWITIFYNGQLSDFTPQFETADEYALYLAGRERVARRWMQKLDEMAIAIIGIAPAHYMIDAAERAILGGGWQPFCTSLGDVREAAEQTAQDLSAFFDKLKTPAILPPKYSGYVGIVPGRKGSKSHYPKPKNAKLPNGKFRN